MNLKTFRAASMAEALAQVKETLGADAVILHTRTFREGGMLGVGAKSIVEVTAADEADAGTLPRRRRVAKQAARGASTASRAERDAAASDAPGTGGGTAIAEPPTSDAFVPAKFDALRPQAEQDSIPRSPSAPVSPRGAERAGAVEPKPQPARPTPVEPSSKAVPAASVEPKRAPAAPANEEAEPLAKVRGLATRVRPAPVDNVAKVTLEDELLSIKRMVSQVLRQSRRAAGSGAWGAADAVGDALQRIDDALSKQDVSASMIERVIGGVRDELDERELADAEVTRNAALRRIAALLPVSPEAAIPERGTDGRPFTIACVGPTGVGKTTTIAKLAATHKLRHGRSVGLITSDTYRIAAVEQLRTYANIIGLPLRVAMTPDEMADACAEMRDRDIVLVDTAGRSQHDTDRVAELADFVAAAQPHRRHLVLSAAAQEAVLTRAAARFASLAPDRVILTKLDECVRFGPLLNVLPEVGVPVSYVTSGQEVPDDIESANADRLARLVLDGSGDA